MLAEQWQRLRAAYDAVLDAPEGDRQRLVEEFTSSDPELGGELSRLLAADGNASDFLETPLARLGPPRLKAGDVLSDRFVLDRLLGQGGMGEVWLARDRSLDGAPIAIKLLRVSGDQDLRRFTNEIHLTRRISHPNVCRVHEFFLDSSVMPARAYLTMEPIEGETLAARLKRGAMPAAEALAAFRQIAAGLEAAHAAGVVHRDLKPANVMLVAGSSNRQAVVMDFGLARDHVRVEGDGATTPGMLVGTPEYMAPEQISGGAITPATDIYALGLVLFEMLRGARPFASSNTLDSWMRRAREGPERLSGAVPGVQARIDGLIRRCLEYDAASRPQSVKELLDLLDSAFYVPVPKSRRFWGTAAAAVLVLAVAGGVFAWSRGRAALPPDQALLWYEEAQQALAEGASGRAHNAINRVIELAPEFAPAHAALADIMLELDLPNAAREAMLRASDVSRDRRGLSAEYVSYMDGIQALLQHRCDHAIARLTRAQLEARADVRPFRMVTTARVLERCEQRDQAIALLDDAAKLDPRNAAVPLRKATFLAVNRQQYAAAEKAFRTAETLFADRGNAEGVAETLLRRGALSARWDELPKATAALNDAWQKASALGNVHQEVRILLQRGIVLRKGGLIDEAERVTGEAVAMARRFGFEALTIDGLFLQGNVHLVEYEFDRAQALFEWAQMVAETYRHEGEQARGRLSMASLFIRKAQPALAQREIAAARPFYERIRHKGNLLSADQLSGQADLLEAHYESARARFAQIAKVAENPAQIATARQNLATALAETGRFEDARREYTAALELHKGAGREPATTYAALNLGDVLSRMGRFSEANETFASVKPEEGAVVPPEVEHLALRHAAADAARRLHLEVAASAARAALALAGGSPERVLRTQLVLALVEARRGHDANADTACTQVLADAGQRGFLAVVRDARLVAAEVALISGRAAAVTEHLRAWQEVPATGGSVDGTVMAALLAAAAERDPVQRVTRRAAAKRAFDELRMQWGDDAVDSWIARPDVSRLVGLARL